MEGNRDSVDISEKLDEPNYLNHRAYDQSGNSKSSGNVQRRNSLIFKQREICEIADPNWM